MRDLLSSRRFLVAILVIDAVGFFSLDFYSATRGIVGNMLVGRVDFLGLAFPYRWLAIASALAIGLHVIARASPIRRG